MTPDEARALLGVVPGLDPKALRRAYLRSLKRFHPERDAEAFMRLRQAYELLVPSARPGERGDGPSPVEQADDPAEVVALQEAVKGCFDFLMTQGPEGVVERARSALERSSRHNTTPRWFPTSMMELILALEEGGGSPEASALQRALADWFERTGAELRLLDGYGVVQWALVRELVALPADFDPGVRHYLAGALARWDWSWGWDELASRLVADPEGTVAVRAALVIHAPGLADLAEPLDALPVSAGPDPMEAEGGRHPPRQRRPLRWGRALIAVLVLVVLAFVCEVALEVWEQLRMQRAVEAELMAEGGFDPVKLEWPNPLTPDHWLQAGYILRAEPGEATRLIFRHCLSVDGQWSEADCTEVQYALRNSLQYRCEAAAYSLGQVLRSRDAGEELVVLAREIHRERCGVDSDEP